MPFLSHHPIYIACHICRENDNGDNFPGMTLSYMHESSDKEIFLLIIGCRFFNNLSDVHVLLTPRRGILNSPDPKIYLGFSIGIRASLGFNLATSQCFISF